MTRTQLEAWLRDNVEPDEEVLVDAVDYLPGSGKIGYLNTFEIKPSPMNGTERAAFIHGAKS